MSMPEGKKNYTQCKLDEKVFLSISFHWSSLSCPGTANCVSLIPAALHILPRHPRRAAQHRAGARAEMAMHTVLLNEAPSSTSCKNQSTPDSIYIGKVPRQREDLVYTQIAPQCPAWRTPEILKNVPAAWEFWCAQESPALGTLLCSVPFLCPQLHHATSSQSPLAKQKTQIKGARGNKTIKK